MFAALARTVHRASTRQTRTPECLARVVRPGPHRMMVRRYTVNAHTGNAAVEPNIHPITGDLIEPRKVCHCEGNALAYIVLQGFFAIKTRGVVRTPLQGLQGWVA
jgi:hypothetical protein